MSADKFEPLVEKLAGDLVPVTPLRAPGWRAAMVLAVVGVAATGAVVAFGDVGGLEQRLSESGMLLGVEMAAMLATAVAATFAAFALSIPGASPRWRLAPLPFLLMWLVSSGAGCLGDWQRRGSVGTLGHMDCLWFILACSVAIAPLVMWRLSRARPIEPLPVALLGALGVAAISALVLQFFHPFAVTMLDLGVHLVAIALVVGVLAMMNRVALVRGA